MQLNNSILLELKNSFQPDLENKVGLIEVIDKHHGYLEDCIAVLTDSETAVEDKQSYLYQFLHILHMHAKAEEETLYAFLHESDVKDARLESVVGQDEHNIIYQLASELIDLDFSVAWSEETQAKAKVLSIIVQTHLEEEEQEMVPLIKECISEREMQKITLNYLKKCEDYLHYEMLSPCHYSSFAYSPTTLPG
jgi:hemerythrin superfamily protein